MTNKYLTYDKLVAFHLAIVSRKSALNYADEMEKAKTPFIFVEEREDHFYNVIGGFKYIAGINLLQKDISLLCTIVGPFKTEKDRKLAILQRCLADGYTTKYRELIVYELTHEYKMDEYSISRELGHDASKIQKYMYKQIIPKVYYQEADKLGIKRFIQAIFLASPYTYKEKCILAELSLHPTEELRFKNKHQPLYRKYRKKFMLFEDFEAAKSQILQAIFTDQATEEYWKSIPHPMYKSTASYFDSSEATH